MTEIKRYRQIGAYNELECMPDGQLCRWSDVEALLKQLPEGMQNCTIRYVACEKGHGRLTATNWVDHGCQHCVLVALQKGQDDLRAKALAAVWLLPEDTGIGIRELLQLREEARAVFIGKDKQVIAKLQDELRNTQEALRHATHPRLPGVNMVYGMTKGYKDVKHVLMITKVQHAPNGGLDIEVQLP